MTNDTQRALLARLENEARDVQAEIDTCNRIIQEATRRRDIAARSRDALGSAINRIAPKPTVVADNGGPSRVA